MTAAWRRLVALSAFVTLLSACVQPPDARQVMPADRSVRVEIVAPTGAGGPMAKLLAESLADAIVRRGAAARVSSGGAPGAEVSHVITGRLVVGDAVGDGRVATLDWQVHGRGERELAATARLPVHGDQASWDYGSPALLRSIGERSARLLASGLGIPPVIVASDPADAAETPPAEPAITASERGDEVQPAAAGAAPPAMPLVGDPPRLWIDEVTGAPGDGNRALTREVTSLVREAGHRFARSPGGADYFIQAVVDVSVVDNITENVEIVWSVRDRNGTELGRIKQNNDMPRGMLHGPWGETARYAALGGLQGIQAILRELGHADPDI